MTGRSLVKHLGYIDARLVEFEDWLRAPEKDLVQDAMQDPDPRAKGWRLRLLRHRRAGTLDASCYLRAVAAMTGGRIYHGFLEHPTHCEAPSIEEESCG